MAFSYSDKNFTVIGNLCFVHIIVDSTKTSFDIPQAISDRMVFDRLNCIYPCFPKDAVDSTQKPCFAMILSGKIFLTEAGDGYLYFYFPIDSNK